MLIRRNNQNEGAGRGVMMRLTVTMEGKMMRLTVTMEGEDDEI